MRWRSWLSPEIVFDMPYKDIDEQKSKIRQYRLRNKEFVQEYLKKNPCVNCGFSDIRALDFDHLDPQLKSNNVKVLMNGTSSINRLKLEINKCQVLCSNCHRIKTIKNGDYITLRNVL